VSPTYILLYACHEKGQREQRDREDPNLTPFVPCGISYVNGWDSIGRPLHYQVPSRNESVDSALNIKYCVWVHLLPLISQLALSQLDWTGLERLIWPLFSHPGHRLVGYGEVDRDDASGYREAGPAR
jgi:hypothetical protein